MKSGHFLPILLVLFTYIASATCPSVINAEKKAPYDKQISILTDFSHSPSFPRDGLCYFISLLHVKSIPVLAYNRDTPIIGKLDPDTKHWFLIKVLLMAPCTPPYN